MPGGRSETKKGLLASKAVRHLARPLMSKWRGPSAEPGETSAEGPHHPLGPVFLCHRDSDGADLTRELAWVLRAHGVPVWVDEDDFPPGDTEKRMEQALAAGLSGAVIVVTPEIKDSKPVQQIELRRILELEDSNPNFILAIANSIQSPTDLSKPDYGAPDRLLREPTSERLAKITQYLILVGAPETLHELAADMARQRLRVLPVADAGTLVLDVESRQRPSARMAGLAHITCRLEGPETGRRTLPARSWGRLWPFLTLLPDLAAECQVANLLVRGGAHLGVGFAIGAALPITGSVRVQVEDRNGVRWGDESGTHVPFNEESHSAGGTSQPVAVYVNMTPRPEGGDAFDRFLEATPEKFGGSLKLTAANPTEIAGANGAASASSLEQRIVQFAAEHRTQEIHLCLRVPFPLAVLLGRRFNTFAVHLYEWEDTGPPRYQSAITVASGRGGGPIIDVAVEE